MPRAASLALIVFAGLNILLSALTLAAAAAKHDIRYLYTLACFDALFFGLGMTLAWFRSRTFYRFRPAALSSHIRLARGLFSRLEFILLWFILLCWFGLLFPYTSGVRQILFFSDLVSLYHTLAAAVNAAAVLFLVFGRNIRFKYPAQHSLGQLTIRIKKSARAKNLLHRSILLASLGSMINLVWVHEMAADNFLGPRADIRLTKISSQNWLYHFSRQGAHLFVTRPVNDSLLYCNLDTDDCHDLKMPPSRDRDSYKDSVIVQNGLQSYLFIASIFNRNGHALYRLDVTGLLTLQSHAALFFKQAPDELKPIKVRSITAPVRLYNASRNGHFYLLDEEQNSLYTLNSRGLLLDRLKLPHHAPTEAAFLSTPDTDWLLNAKKASSQKLPEQRQPDNLLYMRYAYSNTLSLVQQKPARLLFDIPLARGMTSWLGGGGVAVQNNEVWVSVFSADRLVVTDLSGVVVTELETGAGPRLVIGLPDRRLVAVLSYYAGYAEFYRQSDYSLCFKLPVSKGLHDLDIYDDNLYLAGRDGLYKMKMPATCDLDGRPY